MTMRPQLRRITLAITGSGGRGWGWGEKVRERGGGVKGEGGE